MSHEDPMPVFTIKGQDRLAVAAVEGYRAICENAGLTEQAHQVAIAGREIHDWQQRNPDRLKFPDHKHVPARPVRPEQEERAERVAEAFHEAYERLARDHGYVTRERSAVPWAEVPEDNKGLMIATAHDLLDRGVIR